MKGNYLEHYSIEGKLKEKGITLELLVETGMEMYIEDPLIGKKDKVAIHLKK